MFPGLEPPSPTKFYLLTDQLASSGLFLLHRALHAQLSDGKSCILVSFSESLSHWKTVAHKQLRLDQYLTTNNLLFIDCLSHPGSDNHRESAPSTSGSVTCSPLCVGEGLRSLFDLLEEGLRSMPHPLLIIDDLSIVEWVGFAVNEIHRFLRALLHLVRTNEGSLLIRYHSLVLEDPSELQFILLGHCDLHIEVLGLSSGRSTAVSGEIAVHPGPKHEPDSWGKVWRTRQKALQYRLSEYGVTFFERGTSTNVL